MVHYLSFVLLFSKRLERQQVYQLENKESLMSD